MTSNEYILAFTVVVLAIGCGCLAKCYSSEKNQRLMYEAQKSKLTVTGEKLQHQNQTNAVEIQRLRDVAETQRLSDAAEIQRLRGENQCLSRITEINNRIEQLQAEILALRNKKPEEEVAAENQPGDRDRQEQEREYAILLEIAKRNDEIKKLQEQLAKAKLPGIKSEVLVAQLQRNAQLMQTLLDETLTDQGTPDRNRVDFRKIQRRILELNTDFETTVQDLQNRINQVTTMLQNS
ncbi:MAG: hypothetical protein LBR79_01615 [Oscillospiraceae bacterium]|jgi:hypothetical protein|nr:hypothetical protein [Oscillospiraceae bacterium]